MAVEIEVQELTTYSVDDDGNSVVLRLTDASGKAMALRFALDNLGMLSMTLPTLLEAALRRRNRDAQLRYTHPMSDWSIEQSNDPLHIIFSMKTNDGFGVRFSMPRAKARQLGGALSDASVANMAAALH